MKTAPASGVMFVISFVVPHEAKADEIDRLDKELHPFAQYQCVICTQLIPLLLERVSAR